MVFDLDPYIYAGTEKKGDEPAFNKRGFEKTREIAFKLKEILEQLRLSSFVKTTGKTGLHIYVPVLRQYTYDEIRSASATIGQFMVQQYPDDVTMEWQTQKRTGKVFFDHGQNARGKDAGGAVLAAAVGGGERVGAGDVVGAGVDLADGLRSGYGAGAGGGGGGSVGGDPGCEAGSEGADRESALVAVFDVGVCRDCRVCGPSAGRK